MPDASSPRKSAVPETRIAPCNDRPAAADGPFVVYWMRAFRRPGWNFALDRAVDWARDRNLPLLILETLPCGLRWANRRLHTFARQGMTDLGEHFSRYPVAYYPFLERTHQEAVELIAALSADACVVVTDEYPTCPAAEELQAAAARVVVRMECVDSNGLLPLRAADREFVVARSFRSFLHQHLPDHLDVTPRVDPLKRLPDVPPPKLPTAVTRRWPPVPWQRPETIDALFDTLPIDQQVSPVALPGGFHAGRARTQAFLEHKLRKYPDDRNQPDLEGNSGLSPYLHWGYVSTHEIFHALAQRENWSPQGMHQDRPRSHGRTSHAGWWGMGEAAQAFLDELVTWRELGFNLSSRRADYERYESLPAWAQKTLAKHADDIRDPIYTLQQFESAATHDPLWNAAQTQLLREGRMHNYLRMLWGKKIVQWSPSPQDALQTLVELNNRYALDGQDPNSYSGIFWVLGRYDRPWGPERPIFGTIRYMSSESTARKVRVKQYLQKYGPSGSPIRD